MAKIKIALISPTGYGKTTTAKIIVEQYNFQLFKLAEPLYAIQNQIYTTLGLTINGQDGELLQFLGNKIQKLKPDFLATQFFDKINNINLVINDDCRPHNYLYLKKEGFIFIALNSFSRIRSEDISQIDPENSIEWTKEQSLNHADYILENNNDLVTLHNNIKSLMEKISDKQK